MGPSARSVNSPSWGEILPLWSHTCNLSIPRYSELWKVSLSLLLKSLLYLTISKLGLDKIAAQKVIDSTQAGASSSSSLTAADSLITPPRPGSSDSSASQEVSRKRKPSQAKVMSLSLELINFNLILWIFRRNGQMRNKTGPTSIWLSGSDVPPYQSLWCRTRTWLGMWPPSILTPLSPEERRSWWTWSLSLTRTSVRSEKLWAQPAESVLQPIFGALSSPLTPFWVLLRISSTLSPGRDSGLR